MTTPEGDAAAQEAPHDHETATVAEEFEAHTAPSMVHRIVRASLRQPLLILMLTVGLIAVGYFSLTRLPVDAYPDISPPMVEIVTQWPGHAAEEVERLITVPVENGMSGLPKLKVTRSVSLYGLSDVRLTFEDGTDSYFARQQAFERISDIAVPDGVAPGVTPLTSPSGLVYRYVLESPDRSAMELKILQDWVLDKQFRSVPGVADLSSLGGETMEYQVLLDPTKLAGAGLSADAVVTALGANNANAGGGFYSEGGQFYYVRGLGRISTTEDISNIVLKVQNGTPVLVKDVAEVVIGHAPRLGQFGFMSNDDAVEGIVLMRTGEQAQTVLQRVEQKTKELNNGILPADVKIRPFYDRSELVALTTHTVRDNLLRGILLVVVVLIFFLYDIWAGLIVAIAIPLSLLFAFICLDLRHIPANLLSIGAIDFGILVHGAAVMVENIYRQLSLETDENVGIRQVIAAAAAEVDRPIAYAVGVVVASFLPIYVLSGPSGRLFLPMADTMIFALFGALFVTLTVIPVLCSVLLRVGHKERRNVVYEWILERYARVLAWSLARPRIVIGGSIVSFIVSLLIFANVGAVFMPKLDEGTLWVRATMPYTISFDESSKLVPQIRAALRSFPEVTTVTSEHGRPDDGTNPTGFFNAEFYVGLLPYGDWKWERHNKAELIDVIDKKLAVFPGVSFNYTQPAEDAVDEAETGLKSSLDVKLFGTDLGLLEERGKAIKRVLDGVPGITHVTLVQELGQPSLTIDVDRGKIAKFGLNVADVNGLIEAAVGGKAATQVVQGERTFDLVVRLRPEIRQTPEQIGNILVSTPSGAQVPLRELATIGVNTGASFIYRQDNSRYIGIQYSVEGRDLAGAVEDAQKRVADQVKLPSGYHIAWGGEYEEYTASRGQLRVVIPITLALIYILLFALYQNFKFPAITVAGVLLSAPLGGVLALWLTGTPFSVSSGIGFLALFGVSVQTAVVFISYANELRQQGRSIAAATHEAALLRLRPILMTGLVAALGLLPAAFSTGVGSDSQRPFALVIVGGLFSRLLISVFLMPVLYAVVAREGDELEV